MAKLQVYKLTGLKSKEGPNKLKWVRNKKKEVNTL